MFYNCCFVADEILLFFLYVYESLNEISKYFFFCIFSLHTFTDTFDSLEQYTIILVFYFLTFLRSLFDTFCFKIFCYKLSCSCCWLCVGFYVLYFSQVEIFFLFFFSSCVCVCCFFGLDFHLWKSIEFCWCLLIGTERKTTEKQKKLKNVYVCQRLFFFLL